MSKVYKCDRCGNIMGIKDYVATEYQIHRTATNLNDIKNTMKILDLCPKCCIELKSWLGENQKG